MLAHFRVKGQHFLSPCAKLKNNITKRNFGIGVLKQFGTTYECPIFSLKINPPYWEDSESHWWRSGLLYNRVRIWLFQASRPGSNLMVYIIRTFNPNPHCRGHIFPTQIQMQKCSEMSEVKKYWKPYLFLAKCLKIMFAEESFV